MIIQFRGMDIQNQVSEAWKILFYETLYSLMRSSKLEGKFFWYMNFSLFITEFPKPGKGAWHTTGAKKKMYFSSD